MFRQYSKTLSLIAIAAVLFFGDFAVELLAPDLARIFEQAPQFKRLLWALILICLAATVFLFVREHNALAREIERAADAVFLTEADQANRRVMLGLVRRNWIEGVLNKSLWNEARLILNLEGRSDVVVRPCDLALRRAGQPDTHIQPGTTILEIYRREQEELLLLGEPGSGKTTLLLEITEALLHEAENNPTLPIPVVFNLSAWHKKHPQLDTWLVEQLNREYGIPKATGKRWVGNGALLLLLDGLDEVAPNRRAACVDAINVYRLKHQRVLRPMVVCCRTREYDEITALRLNGAVNILPLTRQQVDRYLKDGGKPLAGLRAVLKDEPALYQELFTTPLTLHVAVITYEGLSAAELRRSAKPEDRRRRLWDAYIERMFERKQEEKPQYDNSRALDWLGWLGDYLTRKDLQKYLIEGMQPNDLPRRWQTFLVRWFLTILTGILFLLFLWNDLGSTEEGYPHGEEDIAGSSHYISAILGVMMTVAAWISIFYSHNIELAPIRRFSFQRVRQPWKSILFRVAKEAGRGARGGAVIGVMIGAVFSVMFLVVDVVESTKPFKMLDVMLAVATLMAISAVFMAVFGVVLNPIQVAIAGVFKESVLENTICPNEGIHYSLRTAIVGVALTQVFSVALGLAFGAGARAEIWLAITLGVVLGTLLGVFVAMPFGGRSVCQHYLLRLLLWQSGQFPFNITRFLDWAAQRVLVQRVGGGWKFVHRTLQERFAERYIEKLSRSTES